jgi:ankyrin repeat protein
MSRCQSLASHGVHPLMQAAAAGNAIDVQMLISSFEVDAADIVYRKDEKGRTSLHIAAMGASIEIIKQMLNSPSSIILKMRDEDIKRLKTVS